MCGATYVPPHHQTNPNGSTYDNYETRGNHTPEQPGGAVLIDPYHPPASTRGRQAAP